MGTIYTVQPDETTGKDTYIYQGAATTNYGTATTLAVGKNSALTNINYATLLSFDLSWCPSNIWINSFVISLYVSSEWLDNTATLYSYRLLRNWVELEATWNIYSTGNSWSGGAGSDWDATVLSTNSLSSTVSGWVDLDMNVAEIMKMTSLVYPNNYGFRIVCDVGASTNDGLSFHSSSGATANLRPMLTMDYEIPNISPIWIM